MEKKENSQLKSNVISGISSTAGAVAGVVGGSMVTAEVNAAEMPEATAEEQEVEVVSAEPSRTSGNQSHHEEQPAVEQPEPVTPEPVNPEPQKPDPVAPEPPLVTPEPIDGDEIQVLSYDTITDNDGNEMDVAVVSSSGQEIIIADVDQNGTADLMASDLNSNGQLEENEIVDVSEDNIAMQPLEEAANANDDMIAQTDDIDYVNNADVNDYMA